MAKKMYSFTLQQWFEAALRRAHEGPLERNGDDTGGCTYAPSNGLPPCFIGNAIDDEEVQMNWDDRNMCVEHLLLRGEIGLEGYDAVNDMDQCDIATNLLSDLQNIHDRYKPTRWLAWLREFQRKHRLQWPDWAPETDLPSTSSRMNDMDN